MDIFQTVWKLFTLLETFQTVQKLSRLFRNFPYCLKTFQTVWKLSRLSINFLDSPETFQTVWKLSRLSGKFKDHLKTVRRFENFLEWLEIFQAGSGWQKLCESTKGLHQKVGNYTKVLSTIIRYIVVKMRIATIYALFGSLWAIIILN